MPEKLMPGRLPSGLPGDPPAVPPLDCLLRVDQAGEYGAVRLYKGQLKVLGRRGKTGRHLDEIRSMADEERVHLATFSALAEEYGTRPTVFLPLWHVLAYAMGAGSALLGEKAAMACTVAVEEVIDGHYARQQKVLGQLKAQGIECDNLATVLTATRADENRHRAQGVAAGGPEMRAYPLFRALVATSCRAAIWLSEKA